MRRRILGGLTALALFAFVPTGAPPVQASEQASEHASERAKKSETRSTVVFLARHAEKRSGDDPELTEHGRSRAAILARMLSHEKLDAVLSTPFRRTLQTALPVAESQGLETVVTPIEGSAATFVAGLGKKILRDHQGQRVLVVGHSNTVPETMDALGARGVPRLTEREYGDLFVVFVPTEGEPTWLRLSLPTGE